MSQEDHSVVAPSASSRRVQCSASTLMEARYPEVEESPDSMAGTASHWAAGEILWGRKVAVGVKAPNGVYLDAEMIEGADLYADDIVQALKPHGMSPRGHGKIEQRVAIPRVHEKSFGTPDFRAWLPGNHLMLWDYKFGYRIVEAFENWQCVEYVAGVLPECPNPSATDMSIKVTVTIVQPRAFHREGPIRRWTFMAEDIRALVNIASNAAHEALGPNPRARVGLECRDCKARHACTTLQQSGYEGCYEAGAPQPFDLPVPAMALEYRKLKRYSALMKARLDGLEQQLLARGRAGHAMPGLRIEHGAGREHWKIPDAQVIAIGKALGVDIAKPPEALTPKQAVAAGLTPAVLSDIVNSPRGEPKLVEDDGTLARRVFA